MVYDVSALTTDFYELTMMQGYYLNNENPDVVFDMFYRKNPFDGGYAIFAGLRKGFFYSSIREFLPPHHSKASVSPGSSTSRLYAEPCAGRWSSR